MASLQDLNTIAQDTGFQGRCIVALETAAINVMAEAGNTVNHAHRVGYAAGVINGQINAYFLALAVLTNSTIASEAIISTPGNGVPDSDIQFTMNSIFNSLAGIPAN